MRSQDWDRVEEFVFDSSVNSVQWGPWEYGLIFAAGSSDGKITVVERHADDSWDKHSFEAHIQGVNSVSWGPPTNPALINFDNNVSCDSISPKRFVSGGIDGNVTVWNYNHNLKTWDKVELPQVHNESWVRDVAWASNIGQD